MVGSEWRIGKKLFRSLFAIRHFPFATVTRYSPTYVTRFLDIGLSLASTSLQLGRKKPGPSAIRSRFVDGINGLRCMSWKPGSKREAGLRAAARLSRTCAAIFEDEPFLKISEASRPDKPFLKIDRLRNRNYCSGDFVAAYRDLPGGMEELWIRKSLDCWERR